MNGSRIRLDRLSRFARLGLTLGACSVLTGCTTAAVLEKWENRKQVSSVRVRLLDASPDSVKLSWFASVPQDEELTGTLAFDPELRGCTSVPVVLARSNGNLHLSLHEDLTIPADAVERRWTTEEFWTDVDTPTCTILLRLRPAERSDQIELVAMHHQATPIVEPFESRQTQWLFLLPLSVVADTTIIPGAVIAIGLTTDDEGVRHFLGRALKALGAEGTTR